MKTLKEKRKEINITQIEAARLLGISRRTYQTYEEKATLSPAYLELVQKLEEMHILDSRNVILSRKQIRSAANGILVNYPEVECAYLFGSYARNEATFKSDVDIFLVLNKTMDIKYYGIAYKFSELLNKDVDLINFEQIKNNEKMLLRILKEGIKIYG